MYALRMHKELLPQKITGLAVGSKLIAGISFLFPLTPTDMPMEQRLKCDDSNYQCTRRKHRKQIYHLRVTNILLRITQNLKAVKEKHTEK